MRERPEDAFIAHTALRRCGCFQSRSERDVGFDELRLIAERLLRFAAPRTLGAARLRRVEQRLLLMRWRSPGRIRRDRVPAGADELEVFDDDRQLVPLAVA